MAATQFPSKYALIVTGHAGPLGPNPGLLKAVADHVKNSAAGSGPGQMPGYAAFVSNETYHFVAPFDSLAELDEWPSVAKSLRESGEAGATLNKQVDAAFSGVDTQIIEYREEYSNWPADGPLPDELTAITISVNHTKWDEFHAAAGEAIAKMKAQSGRDWITFSNQTGDISKFHIIVDASADWWDDSSQFSKLLGAVNHTVNKRLTHKPDLGTLN